MQKLLTKEIEQKFEKFGIGSQDLLGKNAKVLVKFFNPYGTGTWLITEAEKQEDGDWLLFGYCHLYEWEWGYVSFNELSSIRISIGGCKLPLERDTSVEPLKYTVKELVKGEY